MLPKPVPPVLSVLTSSRNPKQNSFHFRFSYRPLNLKVSATKQQQQLPEPKADKKNPRSSDLGWLPAFPHVLIASMSNFLFGYHIGFVSLSYHVLQYLCSNYLDDGTRLDETAQETGQLFRSICNQTLVQMKFACPFMFSSLCQIVLLIKR